MHFDQVLPNIYLQLASTIVTETFKAVSEREIVHGELVITLAELLMVVMKLIIRMIMIVMIIIMMMMEELMDFLGQPVRAISSPGLQLEDLICPDGKGRVSATALIFVLFVHFDFEYDVRLAWNLQK